MFVNPGGPGQSGVELVRDGGADFDAWGDGRFDVVGWDPRGTNDSSPVECFTSSEAEARFWEGVSIPSTPAESEAYQRKTVELAQRCGEVSGELLSHITTADTARDLEALRRLVGDQTLTYVGLSYGSMIGQTYANLFPGRVRAMMLDGIVDAVDYTTSWRRTSATLSRPPTRSSSSSSRCARTRVPVAVRSPATARPVAQRVARLFARARRAPIPAPNADPPGELSYGDLLVSTFNPLRLPLTWPQFAADLDAAADGDASALETAARAMQTPAAFASATTSTAISCGDGPARVPSSAWPEAIARFTDSGELWGPVLGWWLWAPCASRLARRRHRPLHRAVERPDRDPDPADQRPVRPRHALPQRPGRREAARQRRAAHPERLGPPELPGPQHVHRRGAECATSSTSSPHREARSANPTRARSPNLARNGCCADYLRICRM